MTIAHLVSVASVKLSSQTQSMQNKCPSLCFLYIKLNLPTPTMDNRIFIVIEVSLLSSQNVNRRQKLYVTPTTGEATLLGFEPCWRSLLSQPTWVSLICKALASLGPRTLGSPKSYHTCYRDSKGQSPWARSPSSCSSFASKGVLSPLVSSKKENIRSLMSSGFRKIRPGRKVSFAQFLSWHGSPQLPLGAGLVGGGGAQRSC